jgi:hypothetical protein
MLARKPGFAGIFRCSGQFNNIEMVGCAACKIPSIFRITAALPEKPSNLAEFRGHY